MTRKKSRRIIRGSSIPHLDLESNAIQKKLLSDDEIPSGAEIEETIISIDEDYQERASEITHLELQQKQSKLHGLRSRSLLASSPIQKLPNEVLMYISNLVSQDNIFDEHDQHLVAKPALVLSSVCSRWRQITISYPVLWSRISLEFWLAKEAQLASLTMGLKRYLERSGSNSLLRLTIVAKGCYDELDYVTSPPLSLLGQHSHRWQYLRFGYLARRALFSFPDNVHEFPMLEELEFGMADTQSLRIFEQAPKLRSLVIESYSYDEPTFAPFVASSFPLQQLTSLVIPYDTEVAKVMDSCPNLLSLQLRMVGEKPGWPEDRPLPNTARTFKSLKSLTFIVASDRVSYVHVLNDVLSSFSCPSLTSLMVGPPYDPTYTWPLHVLESFLMRSSCALTSLSIQGLQISDKDLVTVFRQLSSLTSLILKDHHRFITSGTFTPALIQNLHNFALATPHPPSTPPLLPKLGHLSLAYAGQIFDDEGFVDMIQSRCLFDADAQRRGIEPLRSLVLTSLHRTSDFLDGVAEIYKPLRYLEENGFRITVKGILDSQHLD